MSEVSQNLLKIRKRIDGAASKCGTKPEEIRIVGVVKGVPEEKIEEAISAGLIELGENKAQDILKKYEIFGDRIKWHFVGTLQTNKVKQIVGFVDLIHSLDRISLAEEINKRAEKIRKKQKALVQVNVSGEESKSGIKPEELHGFLEKISKYKNLNIEGLMTIAPLVDNSEKTRLVFKGLVDLFMAEKKKFQSLKYLSMGMTDDFEVAVEEGANMVRIGRAIFFHGKD